MLQNINLLAVLVAAIISFIVGGVWYGPLFGKVWMKLSRVKPSKHGMMNSYFVGFLSTLVMAYVLAQVLFYMDASTIAEGIMGAFFMWFGFIGTISLGSVLWEGKSLKLYLLNNAYNLLSMLIMGMILAVWA